MNYCKEVANVNNKNKKITLEELNIKINKPQLKSYSVFLHKTHDLIDQDTHDEIIRLIRDKMMNRQKEFSINEVEDFHILISKFPPEFIDKTNKLEEQESNRLLEYQSKRVYHLKSAIYINSYIKKNAAKIIKRVNSSNDISIKPKLNLKSIDKNNVGFFYSESNGKYFDVFKSILNGTHITEIKITEFGNDSNNYFVLFPDDKYWSIVASVLNTENIYILDIPLRELIANCQYEKTRLGDIVQSSIRIDNQDENYSKMLYAGRGINGETNNSIRKVIKFMCERKKFDNEIQLAFYLYYKYYRQPNEYAQKRNSFLSDNGYNFNDYSDYRSAKVLVQQRYNKLLKEGLASPKWVSEYSMYHLISKYYEDAIYQYHSDWLGMQSLDVFVPSINTGFEYQGIQHYQPVNFFGGEDGYKQRLILDNKKKEKLKEHNIHFIEWKYNEKISKIVLKTKLKEIGIQL